MNNFLSKVYQILFYRNFAKINTNKIFNKHYFLKVRDVPSVAKLICKSKGKCGDNLEYLQHLVEALKRNFPPCAYDDHLRELVSACDVIKKKICDVTTETDCCGSDKENRLTMVLSNEFTNN